VEGEEKRILKEFRLRVPAATTTKEKENECFDGSNPSFTLNEEEERERDVPWEEMSGDTVAPNVPPNTRSM
jgi:hypothetical protein